MLKFLCYAVPTILTLNTIGLGIAAGYFYWASHNPNAYGKIDMIRNIFLLINMLAIETFFILLVMPGR